MDILSFLPSSSELNSLAFKPWKDKSDSLRLTLSVPHSVSARVGLSEKAGSADVHYIIEAPNVKPDIAGGLETRRGIAYVGSQSPDSIRMLMDDLRPRTSYSVAAVSQGIFDLRGLAYVCGVAAAAGAANLEVNFARNVSTMRLLSPSWTVPVAGELTVGPGIAASAREFVTLASMTHAAGLPRVQLMADLLPNVEVAPLQGCDLSAYAFKLFANIMTAAQGCACGSHHLMAFFRGMTSSWSLWSHTDEGGWLRKALASAVYPPGSGILALTTDEFMSLPLKSRMDSAETTRIAVALYLVLASFVPVADAYATGITTVIDREPGGEARPSCFEGLEDRAYDVLCKWRDLVSPVFGLHPSGISDRYSMDPYFSADRVDTHLDFPAVVPFWWVEPGPLYAYDTGRLAMPCQRGKTVHLPLVNCDGLVVPDLNPNRAGGFARGVRVGLILPPGNMRMCGASYLLSSLYSSSNGLSFFEHVTDPDAGIHTTTTLFADASLTTAADRRWVTPHNPIVNPAENYSNGKYRLDYVYTGRVSDPSLVDWEHCKVESTLGFFLLNEPTGDATTVTHHTVPNGYARVMRYAYTRPTDAHAYKRVTFKTIGTSVEPATTSSPVPPTIEITPSTPNSMISLNARLETAQPPKSEPAAQKVPLEANVGTKQGTDTLHAKNESGTSSV